MKFSNQIQKKCEIELPWPPSVNAIYGYARGNVYLKTKGKEYKDEIYRLVFKNEFDFGLDCDVHVDLFLHPPSLRRYDIDNFNKVLFDGLTDAGVWKDDKHIKTLYTEKREKREGGRVIIRISVYE